MLASVLLYVVQPSRPIDSPVHDCVPSGRGALDHMEHAVVAIVDAFCHARTVKRSGIAWLSATSRIKRRTIENHSRSNR